MNFKDKEFVAAYMWYLVGRLTNTYYKDPQDPFAEQNPKQLWNEFVTGAKENGIDIHIPDFAWTRSYVDNNPQALEKYISGQHTVYHSSYCGWLNPYDTDYPE